jgi:hypothetical protein
VQPGLLVVAGTQNVVSASTNAVAIVMVARPAGLHGLLLARRSCIRGQQLPHCWAGNACCMFASLPGRVYALGPGSSTPGARLG